MELNNRKAKYDFEIIETLEVGIVLTGTEIKSIKQGKANINDSYAIIKNNELFLLNSYVSHYEEGNIFNVEETRTRKLLAHSKEIKKLEKHTSLDGNSLVALKLYLKKNKVKILLGVAKGKKNYDKRETIKKRDLEREARKQLK